MSWFAVCRPFLPQLFQFAEAHIPAPRGSRTITINGAAAHLVHAGDLVIIMSYCLLNDAEARTLKPKVVHVDEDNNVVSLGEDLSEPVPGQPGQKKVADEVL